MRDNGSKLVYSTDHLLPRKDRTAGRAADSASHPPDRRLSIRLERKGRAGKSVTVIEGLRLDEGTREQLLKKLKSRLGTGGTIKGRVIEIQGDHRDSISGILEEMGLGTGKR